ncbi:hypothetical protein BDN72DRAFT_906167 [Pluteus cervinus]|uniref:Uncharacterized protein n=1 Tax=Pluteus cervinus TaxID=181527 RepID=A0ACD3A063_9AGAR|nr:hypothetical protein BDN72DRAFT_906167 [Pluteus cervinus]
MIADEVDDTARTQPPIDRLEERSYPSSEESLSGIQTENEDDSNSASTSQTSIIDDPNPSLTSQTLNADGTPKRPMNAFMIFAQRRRP